VNSDLDCFLLRGKGAAGAAICSGELRPTRPRSIPCGLNQRKNVRGGTEERRGDRGEEEARCSLAASESTGDVCRSGGIPTSNFVVLGRFEQGKKRDAEEECRVFIGEVTEWPLRSPGCGIVGEIKTTVSSERKRPEKKMTCGTRLAVGERGIPGWAGLFGRLLGCCLALGPGHGPVTGFLPFFLFWFFSIFCFSYFLSIICILNPNQAKPISNLF
jgi:hypothetical protein